MSPTNDHHRYLLVSKRFWPIAGETEILAGAFARQLAQSTGGQVDVVTLRVMRHWPEIFQMGRCRIIRLPQSARSGWATPSLGFQGKNRWQRGLQRYVQSHQAEYDAAFVFELAGDQLAPSRILGRSHLPTVSRIETRHFQRLPRSVVRDLSAASSSASWVTPDERLILGGASEPFPRQIQMVSDGWMMDEASIPDQREARDTLARAHPIFQLQRGAILAVCGAELTFDSGVFALVRAWRRVLASHPRARLWMIGDGENAPELFQRICDLDMQHSVLLTGGFDEIRDVLQAADSYIMPGEHELAGWYSRSAAQLGLTIIHHRNAALCDSLSSAAIRIPFDDSQRPLDFVLNRWADSIADRKDDSSHSVRNVRSLEPGCLQSMSDMVRAYLDQLGEHVPRE